jgi:hypothetical protein
MIKLFLLYRFFINISYQKDLSLFFPSRHHHINVFILKVFSPPCKILSHIIEYIILDDSFAFQGDNVFINIFTRLMDFFPILPLVLLCIMVSTAAAAGMYDK